MAEQTLNFQEIATKITELLSKGEQHALQAVLLKGIGEGFYYSVIDKKPVSVPRKGEYYLLPFDEDKSGRLYVFSTYIFSSGLILLVHKEDIELIGFN